MILCCLESVKVLPHYQNAKIGDTVKFECQFHNPVSWKFKNGRLPINAQIIRESATVSMLLITNVQLENTGSYMCYVSAEVLGSDKFFQLQDNGELNVAGMSL